jgi:uncharacterized membrane protein
VIVNLRKLADRFRESLFYLPGVFVVAAAVWAQVMLTIDARTETDDLPGFLQFTVDSAREILSTIAGATITVAGTIFALTALTVQLASSQFSPRVLRGFLRDRFQQAAIGFMVGTFTYALVVLRAVRSAVDDDGSDIVPNLSTGVGLLLAVLAVFAVLAYVNHTAHSLQASELIRRVTDETTALVRRRFPDRGAGTGVPPATVAAPVGDGSVVGATRSGWLQQVDDASLVSALPPGGVVRLDRRVGSYVHEGSRLATVWGPVTDEEEVQRSVRRAVAVGGQRTMQQDASFGIQQLVDIALRALSTGVNDATTAYECIVHLGGVLSDILRRDLPPAIHRGDDERWALRPHEPDHAGFVAEAFDQVRINVAPMPHLTAALVDVMVQLVGELEAVGLAERTVPLRRQVELALEGVAATDPLEGDLEAVREAAAPIGIGPAASAGARRG